MLMGARRRRRAERRVSGVPAPRTRLRNVIWRASGTTKRSAREGGNEMSTEVVMPRMGETVDEGTVNVWHKAPGDQVTEGEPLLEIGTDKVDTDIPAPVSGTLAEIRVAADETVPVGTVLAVIA
jgi:pyruvate dehydrogenase E2 component (dihydrolipoyllysine-residue acetyltransferase)